MILSFDSITLQYKLSRRKSKKEQEREGNRGGGGGRKGREGREEIEWGRIP